MVLSITNMKETDCEFENGGKSLSEEINNVKVVGEDSVILNKVVIRNG